MSEQRQTTLFGSEKTRVGKKDECDVYIGRGESVSGGTPAEIADNHSMVNTPIGETGWLGNPYLEAKYGRKQCIELFREDFVQRLEADAAFRAAVRDLAGKTLGCYCQRLDEDSPACHGEVIAAHADRLAGDTR